MKIIAWNVNGIRAITKKVNFNDFLKKYEPAIFCMSEIKVSCPFVELKEKLKNDIDGYKYRYYSPCAIKAGYSGTAIWSKKKPLNVLYGLPNKDHDLEGRVITLELKKYYLVHVYTPNSGENLKRLEYRVQEWDIYFRKYIKKLNKIKPVILCGDLNVANEEIDLHAPKQNTKNSGFTIEERTSFKKLLKDANMIDSFRYLNPELIKYSYWTYRYNARMKNKGWRIDYFLINEKIKKKIKLSNIITEQKGSDHAPIILEIS